MSGGASPAAPAQVRPPGSGDAPDRASARPRSSAGRDNTGATPVLAKLVALGLLGSDEAHDPGAPWNTALRGEAARQALYDAVCGRIGDFADHHALKLHWTLAAELGITPPFHPAVRRGLHALVCAAGNFCELEVRQLVPLPKGGWSAFKREVEATVADRRPLLQGEFAPRRASLQALLGTLPFDPAHLRMTAADPDLGHRFEEPDQARCDAAAGLKVFRPLATVGMLFLSALKTKPPKIAAFMLAVRRLEMLNSIHGARVADADDRVSALVRIYLLEEEHDGRRDSEGTVVQTIAALRQAIYNIARYARRPVFAPIAHHLRAIVPSSVSLSRQEATLLLRKRERVERRQHCNRNARTNPKVATLSEQFRALSARARVMTIIGDEIRKAAPGAVGSGEVREVAVKVPTLDDTGEPTGALQLERLRVWPTELAMRTFGLPVDHGRLAAAPPCDRYLVEHAGTVPFGKAPANETWAITLAKARVFNMIGQASAERQAERHRTMIRFGVRNPRASHRGLITHRSEKAALVLAAAEAGTDFVPLEEMEAAVRLAALGVAICEDTRIRFESLVQLQVGLFTRNDKGAPTPRHSQWVRPKHARGGNPAEIVPLEVNISEDALAEMLTLCELHKAAFGLARFPTMVPARDLTWKTKPGRYAFSWGGRTLKPDTYTQCLDLLQAGWDRTTAQDLRKSLTEEAALDGESPYLSQLNLGHASSAATPGYRDNPGLPKAAVKLSQNRREDRYDRLRNRREG